MPESHLAACELCGKDGCRTEGHGGEGVNGTDLLLYVSTVQSRYNHVINYAVNYVLISHMVPQVVSAEQCYFGPCLPLPAGSQA